MFTPSCRGKLANNSNVDIVVVLIALLAVVMVVFARLAVRSILEKATGSNSSEDRPTSKDKVITRQFLMVACLDVTVFFLLSL